MLTFKLAGQAFRFQNEELLPADFRASLEVFSLESFSWETKERCAPITIKAVELAADMLAAPPNGEVLFYSGSLNVYDTPEGRLFLVPTEKRCALLTNGSLWTLRLRKGIGNASPAPANLLENLRTLLRVPFEEQTAGQGVLSLHASAFVLDGRAYCTTGRSGAGKSTLAMHFCKAKPDTRMLNGDRPILCAEAGTFYAYGAPWSGKENIFVNASYPLGGIIEVKKCAVNKVYRLSAKKAAKLLMKRVSLALWNHEAVGNTMSAVERAAVTVPVYRMYCTNSISAGEALLEALKNPGSIPELPEGEDIMKIKKNFVMRKMLDEYIVVPVGADSAAAQGAILLNEVGAFLWEKMAEETTRELLLEQLLAEFEVEEAVASADLDEFLQTLRNADVLE